MTNLFLMLLIGFTPAAFGDASCSKDLLPLKKTQPAYPKKALAQDLHGWVTLEFTVNADGSISDATVIENCASNGDFFARINRMIFSIIQRSRHQLALSIKRVKRVKVSRTA